MAQQHKGMAEESKQYLTEVERRDMEMVREGLRDGGVRSRGGAREWCVKGRRKQRRSLSAPACACAFKRYSSVPAWVLPC